MRKYVNKMNCFKKLLLLLSIFSFSAIVNATSLNAIWEEANKAYEQKLYDSAVSNYKLILKTDSLNAQVHYNIANAYRQKHQYGMSILHYKKALKYQEEFAAAAQNLKIVQAQVNNPIVEMPLIFFEKWWYGWLGLLPVNGWAILALLAFVASAYGVYIIFIKKKSLSNPGRWLVFSFAVWGAILSSTYFAYQETVVKQQGVVIFTGGQLLSDPNQNAKNEGVIPEGTIIKVKGTSGNYTKVKLPNGREGWIESKLLGII